MLRHFSEMLFYLGCSSLRQMGFLKLGSCVLNSPMQYQPAYPDGFVRGRWAWPLHPVRFRVCCFWSGRAEGRVPCPPSGQSLGVSARGGRARAVCLQLCFTPGPRSVMALLTRGCGVRVQSAYGVGSVETNRRPLAAAARRCPRRSRPLRPALPPAASQAASPYPAQSAALSALDVIVKGICLSVTAARLTKRSPHHYPYQLCLTELF